MTHAAAMRAIVAITPATVLWLTANMAMALSINGTATYRERMALPSTAVFEAVLEDVSRADRPAETIARTRVAPPGNPPIPFTIEYDPGRILVDHRYVVRARIVADDKLLFTTDAPPAVITRGSPTHVAIVLRKMSSARPSSSKRTGARSLEETYWKAVELAGKPTPTQVSSREAHLRFQPGGRVSGSDGCNRITGAYDLKKDAVTFGDIARTHMACLDTGGIEAAFRAALENARRLTIVGDRLELADAAGTRVAVFTAVADVSQQPTGPAPSSGSPLQGTSWRLVRFQGGDERVLTPDDPAKYTIEFGADGRLRTRLDCNRGRGTWISAGANQLQLGPLALTRATCPPGSLHDHVVTQWPHIRSYVIKDGHLFLALMADGGIYEFEPLVSGTRNPRHP